MATTSSDVTCSGQSFKCWPRRCREDLRQPTRHRPSWKACVPKPAAAGLPLYGLCTECEFEENLRKPRAGATATRTLLQAGRFDSHDERHLRYLAVVTALVAVD